LIRTDSSSSGNWKGVYGSEGRVIIGDKTSPPVYPSYVKMAAPAGLPFVWKEATSDSRGLQQAAGPDRVAGCWFSEQSFNVELDFIDGRTHRVAFYCMDWDNAGRAQVMDILDAETGALLTSQSLADFSGGKYLVCDIKGHVQVRFTRLGGNNAVVMGLFFSPAAIQLGNADSGSLTVASPGLQSGAFQLRVAGQVGERFVIHASEDLVRWSAIGEVTLGGKSANYTDPNASRYPNRFYRALPAAGGY
jgi:hypothetical protein